MASILKSIADKAQSKIDSAMSAPWRAMPKPDMTKAVYNIGMGIGPFIERTVKRINDDSRKRESNKQTKTEAVAANRHKESINTIKAGDKQMLKQFSQMNQILNKIYMVQAQQLKKVPGAKRGLDSSVLPTSMAEQYTGQVTPKKAGGMGLNESGAAFLKFAFGAVGIASIWQLLPQQIKDALKNLGGQIKKDVVDPMIEGVKNWFIESLQENPIATILGTLFIAKITKVLDLAIDLVKGAVFLGKGAANVAEKIFPGAGAKPSGAPVPNAPGGAMPAPGGTTGAPAGKVTPAAEPGGVANTLRGIFGMEKVVTPVKGAPEGAQAMKISDAAKEYKELAKYSTPAYADQVMSKTYGEKALEAIKQAAGATSGEAAAAAKAAEAAASKTAEAAAEATAAGGGKLAGTMKFLSKALGPLGTFLSGYSSYENYQQGKTISGTLDAISAVTGAGAIATGATGVGAPLALGLGAISLISGLAGTVTSMFEKGTPTAAPANPNIEGAPAGATPPLPSAQSLPGIDNDKLLQAIGKLEGGGKYDSDNRVGFVGKYGMGSQALEELGLLKRGASRGREKGPNAALYDPTAWTDGYSLQQFLSNPELQDRTAKLLLRRQYDALERMGIIDDKMSPEEIAGRMYVAWHGGVGGARDLFKNGVAREDFHFRGVTTADSYRKMKDIYGTAGTTSTASTPMPSVQGEAAKPPAPPTGLQAIDITSPQAMMGQLFAQYQDAFNKAIEITTGQPVKIDINNLMADAQQRAGEMRAAPSRSSPSKDNVALERANFVVGAA